MRSVASTAAPGVTASALVLCLPGAYHAAADFLAAGFHTRVRERRLGVDLQFIDLESRYLGDRRPLDELRCGVVLPARARGGRSIWLAGISLGGFLALDYAASNPGDLDGLCLLAPYLGNRRVTGEIARAPGLSAWLAEDSAGTDEERRVWSFLQLRPAPFPALHLGYGREDRFAAAHRLMAGTLPPAAVDVVAGGHDWLTWTTLWENFLDSTFL